MIHLPIRASWLDHVEIYLSVLQRDASTPVDVVDPDALADRIPAFQDRGLIPNIDSPMLR